MTLLHRAFHFGRRGVNGLLRRARSVLRSSGGQTSTLAVLESVVALRNDVALLRDGLRDLRGELAGQLSFLSHDVAEQISTSIAQLESKSAEQLNSLQSASVDARNRLIHLDTSLHSRFNDALNVRFPGILEQIHEVSAFQLKFLNRHPTSTQALDAARPRAANVESFDALLTRAQHEFPEVFAAWRERLEATREALAISDTGNLANAADAYSTLFRAFVEHYAVGALLDVGCGPVSKPFYLSSYPSSLVSGIEPLPLKHRADIEVIQAISEYLPWPDRSFSTVISATSLDHCISLDRSIDEMIRVLRPDGRILLWVGSNPGSPPYRPLDPNFVPADRFHLFHFDTSWFEPMLESRFTVADRVKLDRAAYSHVFYCLRLKA